MKTKINIPELVHYILGGLALLLAWIPIMNFFNGDITKTSIAWLLWYIIIDQLLHVFIKGEKITIIE